MVCIGLSFLRINFFKCIFNPKTIHEKADFLKYYIIYFYKNTHHVS